MTSWKSPPVAQLLCVVFAEIVAQPECLEAIHAARALAPGIRFDIAGLLIARECVDRASTVSPNVQGPCLARRRAMAGLRVYVHRRPDAITAFGILGGNHVREGLHAD